MEDRVADSSHAEREIDHLGPQVVHVGRLAERLLGVEKRAEQETGRVGLECGIGTGVDEFEAGLGIVGRQFDVPLQITDRSAKFAILPGLLVELIVPVGHPLHLVLMQ